METVIRVAFVYVFVLFALRVVGKREFGQLTPFDLVTLLLIPDLVTQALLWEDYSMTNAVIALCTLFTLVFMTSVLTHLSRRSQEIIEGTPTVLVHDGRFIERNMNQQRVPPEEVYAELRKAGLERLDEALWVILETDGRISVVPKRDQDGGAATPEERGEDRAA
mgnify:FL=1